jgi:hypothetical protein
MVYVDPSGTRREKKVLRLQVRDAADEGRRHRSGANVVV